ncbi:MAG: 3-dehydroquinate synthase [Flavobacteriia bacterium]|nr:3-dehydroquinate synthase [Flavobacteriia bacterium]OIP46898.1 MAG: 3-dehydroquinate synthase [Flavobacteriaceae bacterium CG2_30_31_66]PIV97038.1 MAG: 3-dehydroquinate synthase [Flavobacteriaceae bacterium CG17_big_fil_post_rev_8_21_14_2_50_31_13]PIY16334.1 MAG: 3-dehydroquinate synthase [Flavobacteriaceae bacterium CG_4_10_14_3_um_filter_31_253]PIZ12209.1 MAG: 3-dehydroquinate synthase [Flavobacteriaceae bacterium CG_4_10_14_0_8_um_filter_31_99]PJC11278.1 MAG: 3-dehydroquinate synthase [F
MQTIQAATYPIHFQQKGYQNLEKLLTQKKYSTLFILVDENTKQLCYPRFLKHLNTLLSIKIIEIKSGEIHKNLETCVTVWNKITDFGGDRKSLLITLGGGVITDLGGFVASCFKRGIDFINIPTTLLSMVDASVGGKTGVDLGVLKNQIGVFANPQMVIIDEGYLETLATRELTSGMAEIIKHGLIYDAKLFNQIKVFKEQNTNSLIHRSIEIKNEVVLQDPKEKNLRKILNFGHTLGHAIESLYLESDEKENLTHGEAIAIGMICESYISSKLLNFSLQKLAEVRETILSIFPKIILQKTDFPTIVDLLKHDKKNVNGNVNFVLLYDLEDYKIDCKVSQELIIESLLYYNS